MLCRGSGHSQLFSVFQKRKAKKNTKGGEEEENCHLKFKNERDFLHELPKERNTYEISITCEIQKGKLNKNRQYSHDSWDNENNNWNINDRKKNK